MVFMPTRHFTPDDIQWKIMLAKEETYSEREKEWVEEKLKYGEIYPVEVTHEDGQFTISAYLDSPDHRMAVTFPDYVEITKALLITSMVGDAIGD